MKQNELHFLKEKNLLFNKFLIEKLGVPQSFFEETNILLEEAYINGDLKALKAADNDINAQLSHMSINQLILLDTVFKEKLGIRIDEIKKQFLKTINKIKKRGRIQSNDEWRMINEIVSDTTQQEHDINVLNKLLMEYESSFKAK